MLMSLLVPNGPPWDLCLSRTGEEKVIHDLLSTGHFVSKTHGIEGTHGIVVVVPTASFPDVHSFYLFLFSGLMGENMIHQCRTNTSQFKSKCMQLISQLWTCQIADSSIIFLKVQTPLPYALKVSRYASV